MIVKLLKKIDNEVTTFFRRIKKKRNFLFYATNSMNLFMLIELYNHLKKWPGVSISFCVNRPNVGKIRAQNYESDYEYLGINSNSIISYSLAYYKKWDAIFTATFELPWFCRHSRFVQTYHGVAAKLYQFKKNGQIEYKDYRYHHTLSNYDLIFFINQHDMEKAAKQNLLKDKDAAVLTGMLCLDYLVRQNNVESIEKIKKKYLPQEHINDKIILYAPTWGNHNSLAKIGDEILRLLSSLKDSFIIIKPHPLCMLEKVGCTELSLEKLLGQTFKNRNYLLVCDKPPYDLMLISDLMLSDFSSISFEYMLLEKPIYTFITDEQYLNVADKMQLNHLIMGSRTFCSYEDLIDNLSFELSFNERRQMQKIAQKYFANIGTSSEIAIQALKKRGYLP